MKKLVILMIALAPMVACVNRAKEEPPMQYINGEYSLFAVKDSSLYLPGQDSTTFDVRIYQGAEGLVLESPKVLINNLFGIKSTTGASHRLKYSFTFIGKTDNRYIYRIPYSEFGDFFGTYYTMNLEHCWVCYKYDDMSNLVDMITFSKAEFEQYFDVVKAHIVN